MRSKLSLLCGVLMSIVASPALAQPAPAPSPATPERTQTTTTTAPTSGWRASKLVGVDVYNNDNEKISDISEILLDTSGKVSGVIIGVGGFLGLGQHDVLVPMEQLKFVNELRAATTRTTTAPPSTTTTSSPGKASARSANEKWYPDHAVMSGRPRVGRFLRWHRAASGAAMALTRQRSPRNTRFTAFDSPASWLQGTPEPSAAR
jgi:sporulation protein YlmC with PRC-barrel domain